MKKLLLLLAVFIAIGAQAQKTIYDSNAQLRTVKSFNAIKVSGGIDLYLSYGDEAVAVSASSTEHRDRIKTEVVDGVLKIGVEYKNGVNIVFYDKDRKMKAYVSYKTLKALSGSGGSDIMVEGSINGADLSLNISGGSDFKGKVHVEKLDVDASGGSDVDIQGKATTVNVDASGGSDFNGFNLVTETANLEASGGCDIELTVNRSLVASASGGSDIRYRGSASANETKSSGASSVKKVGR